MEKNTHCLPVPASAPHWGPTDLSLSLERGSWGQRCNTASLQHNLSSPQPLYAADTYILWATLRRLILASLAICIVNRIETNLENIKSNINNHWERMKKFVSMIQVF